MQMEGIFILNAGTPYERPIKNRIVSAGAKGFLEHIFIQNPLPQDLFLGLTGARYDFDNATIERIAQDEPVLNGYTRKLLVRGPDDWAVEQVGGFWRARSKIVTWNATGDWTKVWSKMFITNQPSGIPPPGATDPVVYCLSGPTLEGQITRLGNIVNLAYELWLRG